MNAVSDRKAASVTLCTPPTVVYIFSHSDNGLTFKQLRRGAGAAHEEGLTCDSLTEPLLLSFFFFSDGFRVSSQALDEPCQQLAWRQLGSGAQTCWQKEAKLELQSSF